VNGSVFFFFSNLKGEKNILFLFFENEIKMAEPLWKYLGLPESDEVAPEPELTCQGNEDLHRSLGYFMFATLAAKLVRVMRDGEIPLFHEIQEWYPRFARAVTLICALTYLLIVAYLITVVFFFPEPGRTASSTFRCAKTPNDYSCFIADDRCSMWRKILWSSSCFTMEELKQISGEGNDPCQHPSLKDTGNLLMAFAFAAGIYTQVRLLRSVFPGLWVSRIICVAILFPICLHDIYANFMWIFSISLGAVGFVLPIIVVEVLTVTLVTTGILLRIVRRN